MCASVILPREKRRAIERVQSAEGKNGFLLGLMDDGKGSCKNGFILRDNQWMCGCCHKQCFDFYDRNF